MHKWMHKQRCHKSLVTRHEKTGLMYTKYTSSYYGTYILWPYYNLYLNRQLFEILTANLKAGMQLTRYDLKHCRMVTCTFNFFPSFSDDSNKKVNKMIIRNAVLCISIP